MKATKEKAEKATSPAALLEGIMKLQERIQGESLPERIAGVRLGGVLLRGSAAEEVSSLVDEIDEAGWTVPDALLERVIRELRRFWPDATYAERARAAHRARFHGTLAVVLWVASASEPGPKSPFDPGPLMDRARVNLDAWWPTSHMTQGQANVALALEVIEVYRERHRITRFT